MTIQFEISDHLYKCLKKRIEFHAASELDMLVNKGKVVEQEPKTGHWIMTNDYFTGAYESIDYVKCSCCHADSLEEGNYCPNCGARMSEVSE